MSLQCGIVGLPNVGKSTLFNALTKAGIAAENYPFCTIEPNTGVVEVPDPRLAALSEVVQPERVVPAIVEFVDIAGLVRGASRGEGLGIEVAQAQGSLVAGQQGMQVRLTQRTPLLTGQTQPLGQCAQVDEEGITGGHGVISWGR